MRGDWLLWAALSTASAQTVPDIRVDVNLVAVAASVSDRNGAPAQGLHREDFVLLDNKERREVKYLWQEIDLPLTVGLIVDVSGSQSGLIAKHRHTVSAFLEKVIGARDQAFIVTVARDVKLLTDLTGSTQDLSNGMEKIDGRQRFGTQLGEPCRGPESPPRKRRGRPKALGCGGTALWNAVYSASRLKMKNVTGRKALIVLSDGMDTGSFHTLSDAIEASQSADTLVYTIKETSTTMKIMVPEYAIATALSHGLQKLSEETGGHAYPGPKGDPTLLFTQIENELRSLYVLGFTPPDGARDGASRKLDVQLSRPGFTVRARKSYSLAR